LVVGDGRRVWREEAGVADDEDEPTAVSQDAMYGGEGRTEVGDVHQRKLTGDNVEALIGELPKLLCVVFDVAEVRGAAMLAGQFQHDRRAIGADDLQCACISECSRCESLSTAEVKNPQPCDIAYESHRRVQRGLMRAAARDD